MLGALKALDTVLQRVDAGSLPAAAALEALLGAALGVVGPRSPVKIRSEVPRGNSLRGTASRSAKIVVRVAIAATVCCACVAQVAI